MPSQAMIEGSRMIAAMLPRGADRPEITIRSRRTPEGQAIAFTVWPATMGAPAGEYRTTVLVHADDGARRRAALARLEQLVVRACDSALLRELRRQEIMACDADEDGDVMVDDDMPTPAWRVHCPLALRRACDQAEMTDEARLDMVDRCAGIAVGRAYVAVEHRDDEEAPRRPDGGRWVRRIRIEAPGVVYSQGVTASYLQIDTDLPATMIHGLVGRPARDLVDLPGLDAPGLVIEGLAPGGRRRRGTRFRISRAFSTLAPMPGRAA